MRLLVILLLFATCACLGLAKGYGVHWVRWSFAVPLIVAVFLVAIHPAPAQRRELTPTMTTYVDVVP